MFRISTNVSTKQERIGALAKQSPLMAFTSLAHLMDWLKEAYRRTRKDSARGNFHSLTVVRSTAGDLARVGFIDVSSTDARGRAHVRHSVSDNVPLAGRPDFMAAYRAARRQVFDDAMFCLERNVLAAAQALVDEFGPERVGSFSLISAATRVLERDAKAQGNIAVEEELAEFRAVMAELKAGQAPPVIVEKVAEVKSGMTGQEQAEACRLRVEWLAELGHPLEDITTSLRYNRPQSV